MSQKTRLREVHNKMRARGVIEAPSFPALLVQFVGPGPNEDDFNVAEVGDRIFWRRQTETAADFQARVKAEIPAAEPPEPALIAFFSYDDPCKTRTSET